MVILSMRQNFKQQMYSNQGPLQGCWRFSPTQESSFQLLLEFILYSQKILFDLVLEYRYVLEASITTSVIIMWWSIKMNEFIQPKYPGNVSKQTCFEYLSYIHKTSDRCNRNIWTSLLFLEFFIPASAPDQNGPNLKNWTNLQNKTGPQTDCWIQ